VSVIHLKQENANFFQFSQIVRNTQKPRNTFVF